MPGCIGGGDGGCNMADWTEALGMVTGVLTTVTFVPQMLRTRQIGSARDFSLKMLPKFIAGIGLWLPHGLMTRSMPTVAANTVALMLASYILSVKLRGG